MGHLFFDQYSLLHFSSGVMAYFFGVGIMWWILIHAAFELAENTQAGMDFNNRYLWWFWPGGKPRADTILNSIGDQVFAIVGWFTAQWLDDIGKRNIWYKK